MIQRVQPHELKRELANHGCKVHVIQAPHGYPKKEALGHAPATKEEPVDVSEVEIDPWRGPRQLMNDGTFRYPRNWLGMTTTMKEVVLNQTARRNRGVKQQYDALVKKYFAKIEEDQLKAALEEVDRTLEQESKAGLNKVLERMQRQDEVPELSLQQALSLQSNLLDSFENPEFRTRLKGIVKEYAANSTRLSTERHNLIFDVHSKVLPMYGFENTYKGVYDMRQVFSKSDWADDADVKRNQARMSYLLYGVGEGEEEKQQEEDEADEAEAEARPAEKPAYRYAAAEGRCLKEQGKPLPVWTPVTYEQLTEKCDRKAPGIYYGFEFPFTSKLLEEMGAKWLTKAFKAAETIAEDDQVTSVKNVKDFVKGGAGSKFTFEVTYRSKAASLHTRLFAKIPFPMTQQTRSDRMAMSINQQGQEMQEISTYRLLESRFPFRIPRYYFGDISNETTNFILITEAVPYGEKDGDYQLEPAYHKMKDVELGGPPEDYYYLLIRIGAQLAAIYKKGELAPVDLLDKVFGNSAMRPMELWGMSPGNTGLKDQEFKMKIAMGADFVGSIAKELFPPECTTDAFLIKYQTVLSKVNAYTAEARYWCNRNEDYIAWTHINLNVDNVFFWRDERGKLDAGVLDWGGVTCDSVGYKLWWWLYCCEYEFLTAHIDGLLQYFVDVYREHCGIELSKDELKLQFILSAMLQGIGVLGAVPLIYRMCSKKVWKTIRERTDPRIYSDINGTGNLRVYIGTFVNVVRMIHDWGIEEVVDKWIEDFSAASSMPKKSYTVPK